MQDQIEIELKMAVSIRTMPSLRMRTVRFYCSGPLSARGVLLLPYCLSYLSYSGITYKLFIYQLPLINTIYYSSKVRRESTVSVS